MPTSNCSIARIPGSPVLKPFANSHRGISFALAVPSKPFLLSSRAFASSRGT